ncbi:hypothetical protein D3C87_1516110 [compost metagenome]
MLALVGHLGMHMLLVPVDLGGQLLALAVGKLQVRDEPGSQAPGDTAAQDAEFVEMGGDGFALLAHHRADGNEHACRNGTEPTGIDGNLVIGPAATVGQGVPPRQRPDESDIIPFEGRAQTFVIDCSGQRHGLPFPIAITSENPKCESLRISPKVCSSERKAVNLFLTRRFGASAFRKLNAPPCRIPIDTSC